MKVLSAAASPEAFTTVCRDEAAPPSGPPVLLHTEIMSEHLLVTQSPGGSWRLSGLLDFEPAMRGEREYEFVGAGGLRLRLGEAYAQAKAVQYPEEPQCGQDGARHGTADGQDGGQQQEHLD